jgi:hypothetical protein
MSQAERAPNVCVQQYNGGLDFRQDAIEDLLPVAGWVEILFGDTNNHS